MDWVQNYSRNAIPPMLMEADEVPFADLLEYNKKLKAELEEAKTTLSQLQNHIMWLEQNLNENQMKIDFLSKKDALSPNDAHQLHYNEQTTHHLDAPVDVPDKTADGKVKRKMGRRRKNSTGEDEDEKKKKRREYQKLWAREKRKKKKQELEMSDKVVDGLPLEHPAVISQMTAITHLHGEPLTANVTVGVPVDLDPSLKIIESKPDEDLIRKDLNSEPAAGVDLLNAPTDFLR